MGYEVPFFNRVGDKLLEDVENQELTQEEVINQALQAECRIPPAVSYGSDSADDVASPTIKLDVMDTTDTFVAEEDLQM